MTIALTLGFTSFERASAVSSNSCGEDFFVRLDGHEVKPFTVLPALQSGAISAQAWDQQCTALGIAGADLSGVAAPAPDVDG